MSTQLLEAVRIVAGGRTFRRRITDKLELSDRVEWVRLALRLGLLADGDEA